MKKYLLFSFIALLFAGSLSAQTSKTDKYLEKANKLIEDNKIDDADKYLDGILRKNPDFGKGWDLLVQLRYKEYQDSKQEDNLFDNLKVTTTDKKGDTLKNDTLAQKLMDLLSQMKPSKRAFNKFLYTLREATIMCNSSFFSCFYLRHLYVDIEIDTNVSDKALKYFNDAEKEFGDKNYQKAALLYKRAISEQPNFYKANMYLGDAYYFSAAYADAGNVFKGCVEKFPFLVEPRKYLIDTYLKEELYSNALDECINAIAVYPDCVIPQRMEDAAYYLNKKVNIQWTGRPIFPNKISTDTSADLSAYHPDKELTAKGPWKYYAGAMDKIRGNCSNKGIITKPTTLTDSKYMEVYSWEEMLKNSNDPSLDEARKMQKAGYLDCYVLVTCFHQDFYEQYKDFVSKNKAKITDYYNKFIN